MAELVYDENGRLLFTKEMKEEYTILFPTMLPVHFGLMARILETEGFHVEMLTTNHRGIVDEGLKYVHNDTCYPALLVIGQLIDAVKSGKYDMHKVALLITQTGGGCRASNYIHLLRKALEKAGLSYIPVISVNLSGLEPNPGFKLGLNTLRKAVFAMMYGDIIVQTANQVRPYEVSRGQTDETIEAVETQLLEAMNQGKGLSFKSMVANFDRIVAAFKAIPVAGEPKVRVGVVGEIYIKYSPLGNNNLEEFLLSEGAEPVVPGLTDFIIFKIYNREVDVNIYGGKWVKKKVCQVLKGYVEKCQRAMIAAMKKGGFRAPGTFEDLRRLIQGYLGEGNKMGGLAAHRRDVGAHPLRHPQHRLHTALRLPAKPHCGQGHDPQAQGRLSLLQHRGHRLRSRGHQDQPGEPHQADAGQRPGPGQAGGGAPGGWGGRSCVRPSPLWTPARKSTSRP